MNQLVIKNLKAEIDGKSILNGVNLTVNSGEIHVLMGPNGSGKTTLAALLLGRPDIKITAGSITLDKTNILKLKPNQRAAAGLFLGFQQPVALPGVNIGQLLRATLLPGQFSTNLLDFRKMLLVKMKELNLAPEFLERSLNDGFSGGEKKRAELLQMSLLQPKIAILDEIDSGVDVDAIKLIAQELKNAVRETNCGLLIITHTPRLLNYLKPQAVHVMIAGSIVASGDQKLLKKIEKTGYQNFRPAPYRSVTSGAGLPIAEL